MTKIRTALGAGALGILGVLLAASAALAQDATGFNSIELSPQSWDTYSIEANNTSGTRVFSVTAAGLVKTGTSACGTATGAGDLCVNGDVDITGSVGLAATTLASVTVTGAAAFNGTVGLGNAAADYITSTGTWQGATPLAFDGATAGTNKTSLTITDPTGANAINIPDASGTVAVSASSPLALSAAGALSLGTTPIANGGTNSATALSGSTIMVSNGTAIVQGDAGTTTTVLHGNAAGAASYSAVVAADIDSGAVTAPKLQAAAADLGAADVNANFGNTNGAFNTNLATDGTVTATGGFVGNADTATTAAGLSATLVETSGGTNQTTYTEGDMLYATAANTLGKLAAGTAGHLLTANGAGTASTYQALTVAAYPGTNASNYLVCNGNVVDGETFTIAARVYELDPSADGCGAVDECVTTGGLLTCAASVPAVAAAINEGGIAATADGTAGVVVYKSAVGVDATATTSTSVNLVFTNATLVGGTAAATKMCIGPFARTFTAAEDTDEIAAVRLPFTIGAFTVEQHTVTTGALVIAASAAAYTMAGNAIIFSGANVVATDLVTIARRTRWPGTRSSSRARTSSRPTS